MKRSDLKKLVKECLMELLQEGLNESISLPVSLRVEVPGQRLSEGRRPTNPFPLQNELSPGERAAMRERIRSELTPDPVPAYDNFGGSTPEVTSQTIRVPASYPQSYAEITGKKTPASIKEDIKRNLGTDDVMADILADTASTTLAEQELGHAMGPTEDAAAAKVAMTTDPTSLFPEASDKWAQLAFMSGAPK
jgi:hypothetical protein